MKKGLKRFGIVFAVILAVFIAFHLLNGWHIVTENSDIQIDYTGEVPAASKLKIKIAGKLFFKNGIEIATTMESPGEITSLGVQKLDYSYKLFGKEKTIQQTINVVDTQAPNITLVTKEDYYTKYNEEYQEEGFSAIDNFDGDITGKVIVTKDKETVYYTVSDSSGNTTKVSRDIPYDDRTSPVITLNGDRIIEVYVNAQYEELDAIAVDDIDGDISDQIVIEDNIDTTKAGTYEVVYRVKDNHENEASVTRKVLVREQTNADREEELGKVIYLTFDDGPGPYTYGLLDLLDRYQIKATFFVCNTAYTDLIKEEYDRGHAIGMHANTHDYDKIYESLDAYYKDLNQISDIIYEQTGERTKLLRFPGGSSVRKEIMPALTKDVIEKGYQYFDWNVSSGDGAAEGTAEGVYSRVTESCSLHKVNVVLQHDSKKWSLDAVEDIIKWGLENGYTFLSLDETSYPAHHS